MNHIPSVLLAALVIKVVVFGVSLAASLAIVALAALYGFHHFIEANKEAPVNEIIKKDFETLKDRQKLDVQLIREEMTQLKSQVDGVKLGSLFNKVPR